MRGLRVAQAFPRRLHLLPSEQEVTEGFEMTQIGGQLLKLSTAELDRTVVLWLRMGWRQVPPTTPHHTTPPRTGRMYILWQYGAGWFLVNQNATTRPTRETET